MGSEPLMTETRIVSRTTPRADRAGKSADHSQSHTGLADACYAYIWAQRGWCTKIHGHLGQTPGLPDLLGCVPIPGTGLAALVAIECKTGKATLSDPQVRQRALLEGGGALYIEARDVHDVEDALYAAGLIAERSLWPRREG